ncbi:MAG: HU family DNA-binding protein [Patescibacteria group bacterium]|nr:HU family DNA-binding protein [Patescibacteria group bacterium]
MTKGDLVKVVASKTGMSNRAANAALEAVLKAISTALVKGDKVTLTGFGTFMVSPRAARKGVNPRTGAVINIKASKAARFKAGKNLRDAVKK